MKKLLLMMAMILPMFITSCSDDNETTVLTGTTWESTEEYGGIVYLRWTLTFQESTFSITMDEDADADGIFDEKDSASGSYSVDGSNVSLSTEGLTMRGTFSDNVMHLDSGEAGGEFVYYKK